jgi:hypothetical protein
MIAAKRFSNILNTDHKLLAIFGGLVFDGIVFVSLVIAVAILFSM